MSVNDKGSNTLSAALGLYNSNQYKTLNEEISYSEYIDRVVKNPSLIRNAYQRLYDMVIEKGSYQFERYRKTLTHYKFFDDSIFGLEDTLDGLVRFLRGAAGHFGTEKRVLLLHGPVGSSKSTICRALKKGLEKYTRTPQGCLYTYKWVDLPTGAEGVYNKSEERAAMNEDPLLLLPEEVRNEIVSQANRKWLADTPEDKRNSQYTLRLEGDINPRSKEFMNFLLEKYNGDISKILEKHIKVIRLVFSEADRRGIGTFQPKDEKNQDATELTGDIHYGQLTTYTDSDGRAFNFDGEFCVANRGLCEFIEVLKLAKEFLYDLLGASQEHSIKPKKFSQVQIDEVIIGHTNNPEFQKLVGDQTMEALRDRTVKLDVPYLLRLSDEIKVYQMDYANGKVRTHIAPHTLEMSAFFAVLTRLQDDRDNKLTLRDKAKLYDGRSLPGYTEDMVKELREKFPDEGMKFGVSARYVQDQISNTLADNFEYVNPFMVLNKLGEGLRNSSLITNEEDRRRYEVCIDHTKKEYEEVIKREVQQALVSDTNAIVRLCNNYIDNVMAFLNKKKVKNPFTGADEEPNERLMREIEEKIGIPEQGAADFRLSISTFMGSLHHQNKTFSWDSNAKLRKALEAKLFEDTKDHIKLSALSSASHVVDPDQQEKIDAIKARLVKHYGYNEQSATDVLQYVAQIFARGDVGDEG